MNIEIHEEVFPIRFARGDEAWLNESHFQSMFILYVDGQEDMGASELETLVRMMAMRGLDLTKVPVSSTTFSGFISSHRAKPRF